MMESNFEVLKSRKLSPVETSRRLEYLEHTIRQLQEYHKRTPAKRSKIQPLVVLYETLAESLRLRLETKGEIL